MKKILNEGNQIHTRNFISSSETVINYGSGSDFLTSYGSGSCSTSQKVTVPTVPVPVPQRWVSRTRCRTQKRTVREGLANSTERQYGIVTFRYRPSDLCGDLFLFIFLSTMVDRGSHGSSHPLRVERETVSTISLFVERTFWLWLGPF
jgi:hypothetical protein